MFDFTVKSSFGDYEVTFVDDVAAALLDRVGPEDVIIIDRRIVDLHRERLIGVLGVAKVVEIEATESQKSYQGLVPVIESLIDQGVKRNSTLVAIGGGITQDVTAFIASVLYRGVPWIFCPTTLLAQGDSCIGSKTSINFGRYKNQLGGFYPPRSVIIDTAFLDTLPELELRSGLGEMAHYFLIAGEDDFQHVCKVYPRALADRRIPVELIARSLQIKKAYVEVDEFDRKERQIFNYGHSFGHAIESVTDYRVPHGIAVAYGMDLANYVSVRLGYMAAEERVRIREFLRPIWDGVDLGRFESAVYEEALLRDKKNQGGKLGLILSRGVGDVFKEFVPLDSTMSSWLREYFITQVAA